MTKQRWQVVTEILDISWSLFLTCLIKVDGDVDLVLVRMLNDGASPDKIKLYTQASKWLRQHVKENNIAFSDVIKMKFYLINDTYRLR